MNKAELIDVVSKKAGMNQKHAANIINCIIETIIRKVAAGEKVSLLGFGTFEAHKRKARTGRNPKTNEPIGIPAKRVTGFRVSKEFGEALIQNQYSLGNQVNKAFNQQLCRPEEEEKLRRQEEEIIRRVSELLRWEEEFRRRKEEHLREEEENLRRVEELLRREEEIRRKEEHLRELKAEHLREVEEERIKREEVEEIFRELVEPADRQQVEPVPSNREAERREAERLHYEQLEDIFDNLLEDRSSEHSEPADRQQIEPEPSNLEAARREEERQQVDRRFREFQFRRWKAYEKFGRPQFETELAGQLVLEAQNEAYIDQRELLKQMQEEFWQQRDFAMSKSHNHAAANLLGFGLELGYVPTIREWGTVLSRIYVREMIELETLLGHQLLPKQLLEFPVEIVALGDIVALSSLANAGGNPNRAVCGDSVAQRGIAFGTIGCIAKWRNPDGVQKLVNDRLIVSNNHVLGDEVRLQSQNPEHREVLHPDGIGSHSIPIADLADTRAIQYGGVIANDMDAAIARLRDPDFVDPDIRSIGRIANKIRNPVSILGVQKHGSGSKFSFGSIKAPCTSITVAYADQRQAKFQDVMEIYGAGQPFATAGDSGSLIVNECNWPVGLLFAAGLTGTSAFAIPIGTVLDTFDIEIVDQ